jgi:hypothetical protein
VLIDLLLVLQYLVARCKFAEFQFHLLLLGQLLQLLRLQLHLLALLVEGQPLAVDEPQPVAVAH